MAALLVNIGIGGAKEPTNNNILRAVQNTNPSDNTINQMLRQAQKHCYKGVATKPESGMPLSFAFDKGERGGLGHSVKELIMFDHYADKIIPIRLNSDGAKGKDGEAAKSIDTTL